MASSAISPQTSAMTLNSSTPTELPAEDAVTLEQLQKSKELQALAAWVKEKHSHAKKERQSKQSQWQQNMAMFFGKQWLEKMPSNLPGNFEDKLILPKAPYYKRRKTVNRIRSFVRAEHSKFLASVPSAVAVPASAEDQDIRAAYAAEQAWNSIQHAQKLRQHYARAAWWTVITGNGFIKTQWNQSAIDKASGESGSILFGSVTPFHLFVPDLREVDIEDQPYVINAYVKPLEWCKTFFAKELKGIDLKPSQHGANSVVEEGHLNLAGAGSQLDSCTVYETWVKPGAHPLLPEGGVLISIDDHLISMHEGMPYDHKQYPFTKFEHIPSATFYADSPIVDLAPLNKEYNELRSDIAESMKRMGRPALMAAQGSIVPSKMTNEIGQIILYRPGLPPPQPLTLPELPQTLLQQQDRVLMDFEEIGGLHDASRGEAPAGVTAGTAINFLQEKDDQFRTSQYQSIEDGYEKIGSQALQLFVQYVDMARKIKVIGADMGYDTMLLQGSDIKSGTDIRIEKGSSIGTSKAAQDARIQDLFAIGMIDQQTALRLIELGGAQKVLDILNVAERKAQRENMQMKLLKVAQIQQHVQGYQQALSMGAINPEVPNPGEVNPPTEDPMMSDPATMGEPPIEGEMMPMEGEAPLNMPPPPPPPVVAVADFDIHEIHIEIHNKFRMTQEYEMLSPEIKDQFAQHVAIHEAMLFAKQFTDPMAMAGGDMGGGATEPPAGPDTLAGNGQAPDLTAQTTGV